MLLAWLACAPVEPTPEVDAARVLRRVSLDVRGRLPTVAELDAVEADPDALDAWIDEALDDPAFGLQVAELWSASLRTRVDRIAYGPIDRITQRALGEEPLRVLARIADEDLPFTEWVVGDWTMADARVGSAWPVEALDGALGEAWEPARYSDGRPSAGILSHNALWWRHRSTAENVNRGRANALSRILLCTDFAARPVHFERASGVLDGEALLSETRTNGACANCHAALDPLGSYLFGFWTFDDVAERATYGAGTERLWQNTTGLGPSFFGTPGWRLDDLGRQVADDPRFVTCAVETAWEGLLRRDATPADVDRLTAHREAFLDGGLTLRALVRSILLDPAYRAVGVADHADNAKLLPPRTLASAITDLTGFTWTGDGIPLLDDDETGVRTLAGGADGREVTAEADAPNATTLLVQERLAEAAALWAVTHDAERPAAARLFDGGALDGDGTPETRAEVARGLFRRLLGQRVAPDGDEVGTVLALWDEARRTEGSAARAWAVVLAFLLRDPDFRVY
jgi:hypothetical protein